MARQTIVRGTSAFLPIGRTILGSFAKFNPRILWHNPVLMLTEVCGVLATAVAITEMFTPGPFTSGGTVLPRGFSWAIAIAIWVTLLTATFAETLAEGHGRLQVEMLRGAERAQSVLRVIHYDNRHDAQARRVTLQVVDAQSLRPGDVIVLESGNPIPTDGEVVGGIGLVDESAITGESAPVIREPSGDRNMVTGGTVLLTDRLVVRVTAVGGQSAVDRMIELASKAHRQRAPRELALFALLASFSLAFIVAAFTLNTIVSPVADPVSIPILAAIVVCLIPTEIAALMSVTGIVSMHQLLVRGVLADSGRALETAGDITAVLLDKTGTVTEGERHATAFVPFGPTPQQELMHTAVLASIGDDTYEGRSIIELARSLGVEIDPDEVEDSRLVSFSAQYRMSGRDFDDGTSIRKGAESSVLGWLKHVGSQQPKPVVDELETLTDPIASDGGTPLIIAIKPAGQPGCLLGVVHLKDVVRAGLPRRVAELRRLGIRTVMITGDNPLTAKAIGREIGVDESIGDATPEDKLAVIQREQAQGHFVAMTGDGANDAPALAQADVGIAMNTSTPEAKAASNMIILDDDPTKIIEIAQIGRRQMATRGALITFNIANDIVRYFALYPALFVGLYPGLSRLNLLHLHSAPSAVLSTLIFSTVVMGILIPLAMFGVPYQMVDLGRSLTRNLVIYGLGGLVIAAIGIKVIDLIVGLIPGY